MAHVPLTAGRTIPFHIPALGKFIPAEGDEPAHVIPNEDIVFHLRIPTWEDRDMIALRIYSLGVREITPEQIQAMTVSEMFEVYDDEERAERDSTWLESHWSAQKQYREALQNWAEQEAIRRLDAKEAKRKFKEEAPPKDPSTARDKARANLVVQEVTDKSRRLREKLADQQLYEKRFQHTMARLQIAGWVGLATEATFDRAPAMDAPCLSKETIEQLRGELEALDSTGAAWEELIAEAGGMFDLPRSAEKNLSSLPGNTSPPNGSKTPSSGLEISIGGSTLPAETVLQSSSSTAPTPGDTSPPTTATSSGSTPG